MEELKFNDDLLLEEVDRERAKAAYPSIFFALDNEALRTEFWKHDPPANEAKRRARQAGLVSVVLTTIALCGAAFAQIYHGSACAWILGTLFSGLGVIGVAIAFFGVLYGPSKSAWLKNRLMTERLRQFHFQTFVSGLSILADPTQRERLFKERCHRAFQAFQQRFEGRLPVELESVAADVQSADIWLSERPSEIADDVLDRIPEDAFAAYRDLRLRHQLNYASGKLLRTHSVFDGKLRSTQRLLAILSIGAVMIVFALDLTGALVTPWHVAGFPEATLHVLVPCFAFVALASRAIEEGMQVRVEIDRYRNYRNTLRALMGRYTDASSRRDKVQVMVDTERLVFLEMKAFLMANHEATFVM